MDKKILINFPTNFGDTILALPAFDRVCASYPGAKFTALVSPHTRDFILGHSFIDEVVVYDKHMSLRQKVRFVCSLRNKYDMMVDFKHSLLPLMIGVSRYTPLWNRKTPKGTHARQVYCRLVDKLVTVDDYAVPLEFIEPDEEKNEWDTLRLGGAICIAASSNSGLKNYPYEHLKIVVENLAREQKVVLLGDQRAKEYYKDITSFPGVVDLSGRTSFLDVYYILKQYAAVLLCVDSSLMHLACYLDVPVCALFGPTDTARYGPWSQRAVTLTNDSVVCRPCRGGFCVFGKRCMDIDPGIVLDEVARLNSYENP